MILPVVHAEAKTAVEVFKSVSKSVVVIKKVDGNGNYIGAGSGVVIEKGSVVTNFHVVEGASRLVVEFEHKQYEATPEYIDHSRDLCLIRIPHLDALPVVVAKSSEIDIGSRVYAVGYPIGVGITFTDGIVSGFREALDGRYIQTTAPVSPGSSGGGLFDENACLIGIPTYLISKGQLLNFALPVEWAVDLVNKHHIARSGSSHEELLHPLRQVVMDER